MTGEPPSTGSRRSHCTHVIVCALLIAGAVFVATVKDGEHGGQLERAATQMEGISSAVSVASPAGDAGLLKEQRLRGPGQEDGAGTVEGASEALRRQVEADTHGGPLGAAEGNGTDVNRHANESKASDHRESMEKEDMCPGGHKVLTVSTTHSDRMCIYLYSALWHGITPKVLGYGGPYRINTDKAYYMILELAQLPADCIVSFSDVDVLFLDNAEGMLTKYQTLGGPKTLVSAECKCYPFRPFHRSDLCEAYPKSPTAYRYLNSGFIMGRAGDLLPFYRRIFEYELDELLAPKGDQERVARMFLMEPNYGIQLDNYANLSLSMTEVTGKDPCPTFAALEMDETSQTYVNVHANNIPSMLHFNGRAHARAGQFWTRHVRKVRKSLGEEAVEKKNKELLDMEIELGYAKRRYGDVCGNWVRAVIQGEEGVEPDTVPYYAREGPKKARESTILPLMKEEQEAIRQRSKETVA